MKKILSTLFAVLASLFLHAQEGDILYTDFEPDLSIAALTATNYGDTIKIDIDQDGTVDFNMWIGVVNSTMVRYVFVSSSWYSRYCYNSPYSYGYVDEYDTLVSQPHYPGRWSNPNSSWEFLWESDYMEFYMGFRKVVDNENYYAWSRIYMYRNPKGQRHHKQHGDYDVVTAYCDNLVYCSIPNYPLRWGQTSLNWNSLEHNQPDVFATVLPNPGKDEVTIKAPVRNALIRFFDLQGRLLLAKPFDFNITFNTGDWTQGIYLWEIWNGARREASGKWIKE